MKTHDPLDLPELATDTEEAARAERLTASFLSDTAPLGDYTIRKPSLAGITILTRARNKFVIGFNEAELRRLFPHGLTPEEARRNNQEFTISEEEFLQYLDHVIALYRVGIATPEELKTWYFHPPAFADAVFEYALTAEIPTPKLNQMFVDAFNLSAETAEAQVKPRPAKNKPLKKKGPRNRHSPSPTPAPSRANSTSAAMKSSTNSPTSTASSISTITSSPKESTSSGPPPATPPTPTPSPRSRKHG